MSAGARKQIEESTAQLSEQILRAVLPAGTNLFGGALVMMSLSMAAFPSRRLLALAFGFVLIVSLRATCSAAQATPAPAKQTVLSETDQYRMSARPS
jgi:hypothetical protein